MNQYTKVYLSKIAKSTPFTWGDWIGAGTVNGVRVQPTPTITQPTPTITQPAVEENSSDLSYWMTGPLVRTGIKLSIMAGILAYSLKQLADQKEEEKKKTISKPTSKPLPDPSPESTKKLPLS